MTERQAITSTPLPRIWVASCLKPGTCLAEQVGVNAPGRANKATFLPPKNASVVTGFGPSAVASVMVTLGRFIADFDGHGSVPLNVPTEIASSPRTASLCARPPLKALRAGSNVEAMHDGFFTGQMLIAMPGISDPRFERALILVCAHDREHAMGIAVNDPIEGLTVPSLLEKLDIQPSIVLPPDLVLLGGPVEGERGFVLHSTDYRGEHTLAVGDGVALSATREVLEAMASHSGAPAKSLLALGYAGWGAGQLETEIKQNVWLSCDAGRGPGLQP